jgi:transcription elongation factor Elf1
MGSSTGELVRWSLADWQDQIDRPRLIPCPQCRREGFFGARAGTERYYWLCKFCGYYREVDKAAVQCRATAHPCMTWPLVLGAPDLWWVQLDERQYRCPRCNRTVLVEEHLQARPLTDPHHPWWQFPQGLTSEQAAAFWRNVGLNRLYL